VPSKYWKYENIKSVHLEVSTLCNSICPWCPRYENFSPNLNPNITEGSYTLERFKNDFPADFIKQIKSWTLAGDYGDPCTAPEIIPILDYINSISHSPTIQINTNGGMKTEKFWHDLGMSMNDNSYVIFSVDGLEDTNHIYRRNVKWNKVVKAMRAYSNTGATGIWEYLKFKHNEHQMSTAKDMADDLGFEIRFKNPNGFEGEPMPARDKDYNIEYIIEPCEDNPIRPITERTKNWINTLDVTDTYKVYNSRESRVHCHANHKFGSGYEVRINYDGTVWPCSFFGHLSSKELTNRYVSKPHQAQAHDIFKNVDNNLNNKRLKEILDNDPFKDVYEGWEDNKIMLCSDSCGQLKTMDKIYARQK